MCGSNGAERRSGGPIPCPRWGVLYGVVGVGIAGVTIADVALPATGRPFVEGLILGAVLAAMYLWVCGNRVALDQQDWCACAASEMTLRVIVSRRPMPPVPAPHDPAELLPADDREPIVSG